MSLSGEQLRSYEKGGSCLCHCHGEATVSSQLSCEHCSWAVADPVGQVYEIEYRWKDHKENPCVHRMADMVDLLQKVKDGQNAD